MDATDPQPKDQSPDDVKRGLRTFVIGLVVLIVIAAIAVALSNLGNDDDPSGGGNEGMAQSVVHGGSPAGSGREFTGVGEPRGASSTIVG
ncbi:MAG: hypothetical protein JWQ45_1951 [Blastococcus sp.]|jgi:hypothetical protein|nr:hypothetical protein [Blastococcus sp.]